MPGFSLPPGLRRRSLRWGEAHGEDPFYSIAPRARPAPLQGDDTKASSPKDSSEGDGSPVDAAREVVACLLQQPKRHPVQHCDSTRMRPRFASSRRVKASIAEDLQRNSALRSFVLGKGRASPFFKQVSNAFTSRQLRQAPRCGSSRSEVGSMPAVRSRTDLVEVRMLPPVDTADPDVSIIDLPDEGLTIFPLGGAAEKEGERPRTAPEGFPERDCTPPLPRARTTQGHYITTPRSRGGAGASPTAESRSTGNVRDRLEAAVKLKIAMLEGQKKPGEGCELAKSCGKDSPANIMKVAPNAWLQQQSWRWGRSALQWEMPQEDRSDSRNEGRGETQSEMTVFEAFDLAEKLNLPPGQVTQAWKVFKRFDANDDGQLNPQEFQLLLRNVLRDQYPSVKDIPRALFSPLGKKRGLDQTFGFSDFLTWWTEHAFDESILLSEEQRTVRRHARQYKVPIPVVEAVKRKFDSYDNNGSGQIEFQEFHNLLFDLLGMSDAMRDCLPQRRVRSFWREIDYNGSGIVEFDEFIPWYLRYFDPSGRSVGISPLEEYYASIRPFPHIPQKHLGD